MALAIVFAFLASFGFASGGILIRIGTQRISAPTATFFTLVSGDVLILGLAFALRTPEILDLPPVAYGWFALMGLLAYPLARVLGNYAITMVGTSRAAPVNSIQPVFALGLAMAFLGERPNLLIGLATPLVVCGLVLVVLTQNAATSANRIMTFNRLGYLLAAAGAL
ncbi:MAG: DMT family transporter, partial [Chloroflexi bacterium]|nr:DMT family transporter [Chloroflexota bacterium]